MLEAWSDSAEWIGAACHECCVACPSVCVCRRPVAEAVVQEAVEAAKAVGPLGSKSGRGLPQIERIRLNVHANQVRPTRLRCRVPVA